jgi:hypothetical protein
MAGLVPAIHVFRSEEKQDVDARHKAGHDDQGARTPDLLIAFRTSEFIFARVVTKPADCLNRVLGRPRESCGMLWNRLIAGILGLYLAFFAGGKLQLWIDDGKVWRY